MTQRVSQLARQATFRQLQVFERIAHHNSFTQAAKELHLTQPTVSMQIKKLSESLGVELFEQIGRKAYLTAAGQQLLVAAKNILESLNQAEEQINHLKGLTGGHLRMTVISTAQYFMPRVLKQFLLDYPNVTVTMRTANKEQLVKRIQNNEDDFYILGQPPDILQVISKRLVANPLYFVAHAAHHLVGKNLVLDDLQNETLLVRESGSGVRAHIERVFNDLGFIAKHQVVLGSNEVIRLGLLENMGIAVVALPTLLQEFERKEIVLLKVKNFPILRHWYLVYPKGKVLSQIAQQFIITMEKESLNLDQTMRDISNQYGF